MGVTMSSPSPRRWTTSRLCTGLPPQERKRYSIEEQHLLKLLRKLLTRMQGAQSDHQAAKTLSAEPRRTLPWDTQWCGQGQVRNPKIDNYSAILEYPAPYYSCEGPYAPFWYEGYHRRFCPTRRPVASLLTGTLGGCD
ncbi:hypothetical protein GWK47_007629 [Chionoecetes opilio]|uniref:Uncharacterized protein n=1 Tax=Chionoecetes opilio TaxID=41210 RepID=A0A8J4Y084_CHIOP|nr:hypothetical protein GWK47_007629 [Chionoecetes opilio]